MAKGSKRDPKLEMMWREIFRRQSGSSVTIRQFCRDNQLAESSFHFWRRELQRRDQQSQRRQRKSSAAGPAAGFVAVSVAGPQRGRGDGSIDAGIEILLPGGSTVRAAVGVGRQMLADVLAVLREAGLC